MSSNYFHPGPGEDQQMILDLVTGFAGDELAPMAESIDHAAALPDELSGQLAEMGLLAIPIAEEKGGAGFDFTSYALSLVELARGSGTTAMHILNQTSFFLSPLSEGNCEHRAFAEVASGEARGALAAAEDTGSWLAEMSTTVSDSKLSGTKTHVLGADDAGWLLVAATEGEGISLFALESSRAGITIGGTAGRLGCRSLRTSTVTFDGVAVSDEDRIGAVGQGNDILRAAETRAQVALACVAAGLSSAARDAAAQYATERKQFRRPISDFEAIRQRLASSELAYGSSMSLILSCSRMIDDGADAAQLARIARVTAVTGAVKATDDALQVYGGYGFSQEYPAERIYRDACSLGVMLGGNDAASQALAAAIIPAE